MLLCRLESMIYLKLFDFLCGGVPGENFFGDDAFF